MQLHHIHFSKCFVSTILHKILNHLKNVVIQLTVCLNFLRLINLSRHRIFRKTSPFFIVALVFVPSFQEGL
jgi:hypothetical protein